MGRITLFFLTTLLTQTTFAKGIKCSADKILLDGTYNEVRIEESKGKYEAIQIYSASIASKTTTTLAKGLRCNFDGVIAYCFVSAKDSGETQHSIVSAKQVITTSLTDLTEPKATRNKPSIYIEVQSPFTTGKETFVFKEAQCEEI